MRPHQGFVLPTMAAPDPLRPPMGPPPPPASSDYTRILKGVPGAPAPRDLPPPPAPAQTEVKGPGGTSYLPLWILLNVVVILAVALVVYVALRRH
jgi:hypothetical protein